MNADRLRRGCENALLALLYFSFLHQHIQQATETHRWVLMAPVLTQETLLAVMFACRRASMNTSQRPFDWGVAIVGAFLPLLVRAGGFGFYTGGMFLQIVGVSISSAALLWLGRSIGLVPSNRGLVTTGPYSIVRHPMYSGHLLTLMGYLVAFPTLRNAAIVMITLVCMIVRIAAEEHLLDEEKLQWPVPLLIPSKYYYYRNDVRCRLIPGIF